jgi:hypothetical protein
MPRAENHAVGWVRANEAEPRAMDIASVALDQGSIEPVQASGRGPPQDLSPMDQDDGRTSESSCKP